MHYCWVSWWLATIACLNISVRWEVVGSSPTSSFPGRIFSTLLKWIVTAAQQCVSIRTIANLLSSVLTILLTCPNSDTLLCYSNDPFLTVFSIGLMRWSPACPTLVCTNGGKRLSLSPKTIIKPAISSWSPCQNVLCLTLAYTKGRTAVSACVRP